MRKYYSNGSGKGGGADRMKSMAEKESDAYNKMRNEMDRQNFLKQRKEEMKEDKKKLNEKKYGIAVKDGGRIEYSKGTMPARNKKNFRSTKSGDGMTEAGIKA